MRTTRVLTFVILVMVVLAGCASSDPTASDEYLALEQDLFIAEQQLTTTEQQLSEVTAERIELEQQLSEVIAERDAFAASEEATTDRYAAAARIQEEMEALLDDTAAFGTAAEVADLLATHATSDAVMHDDVFGGQPYRAGFYNTLFGMGDAEIDVYDSWLCDDGSQGGSLWLWHGTNNAGNPFELAGISLMEHDEDGLISYELVTYPYPDAYVVESFKGSGN